MIAKIRNHGPSPTAWRRFYGWCVILFIVLIPVSAYTGWVKSNIFISYLSIIALILSSLAPWQAAKVEVKQDEHDAN